MLKLWHILAIWFLTAPALVWANSHDINANYTTPPNEVIADPINAGSIQEIADRIINFLLLLAAPIAVIMMVYAGYLFVTAADNKDQVSKARKTILYALVGIAVLALSKAMVNIVINALKS